MFQRQTSSIRNIGVIQIWYLVGRSLRVNGTTDPNNKKEPGGIKEEEEEEEEEEIYIETLRD